MFSQTFVETVDHSRNSWSFITSLAIQTLGVGILALLPLLFTDTLPFRQLSEVFTLPPPPASRPASIPASVQNAVVVQRSFDPRKLTAPTQVPQQVLMIDESAVQVIHSGPFDGGIPNSAGQNLGNLSSTDSSLSAPPPKPPVVTKEEAAPQPSRITVGGNVQGAKLINRVEPRYPRLAIDARVSGTVRFTAVIGRSGEIQNLQLISGHPLLAQSARDAVKQWRYAPTLLNGSAVEVATQIDVNFVLGR